MFFLSFSVYFHTPKSFRLYVQKEHFVAKSTINHGMTVGWMLEHLTLYTQAHTRGVRTCKWATYVAHLSKLGQHLDRHREFNCPLGCGFCLQGSVKEKWHLGTVR